MCECDFAGFQQLLNPIMNESDQPLCSLATSSTLNYKLVHVGKAVIFFFTLPYMPS